MQTLTFPLSSSTKELLHIAEANAKGYYADQYNASHLLRALLHKDIELRSLIEDVSGDIFYMEEWADVRMEALPRAAKIPDQLKADDSIEAIFNEADMVKLKLGKEEITPECVLVAICTPGVGFTYEQLKTLPVKREDILSMCSGEATAKNNSTGTAIGTKQKVSTDVLKKYCIDKSTQARNQELSNVYGRDAEIKMITEILGRHSKPNVLITGEPGVGKSALLNGFTNAVTNGNVQESLKEAQIYELDFIELVSSASYNGEIEDRFKKVITAIKQFTRPILLIDELDNLLDKNSQQKGLINILKSELAKGDITIIGSMTNDTFRKQVESDDTLSRRFEIINLEEPTEQTTARMINHIIESYTQHHKLEIEHPIIEEAIKLSKRFNKERSLPDAAIDLIDRTMSAGRYMLETSSPVIENLKEELSAISVNQNYSEEQKKQELEWFYKDLGNRISYLLFAALKEDDHPTFDSNTTSKEISEKIETILNLLLKEAETERSTITKKDVTATISNKTGIPVGDLLADEKERLLSMEEELKKRVVGQDHAVKTITAAVHESRSGLSKPGLPTGSFFFTGPTGTGKTELAKALAEFLFQTEDAIIRFDMSEFKEEHSAALLYGAPPGYVGYEEGGLLVNKIRQKPYSIVLFDEIEKAHPSVFDIFLQILDEGKLHDRLGKTGDFSHAVVLFTSNVGSKHVVKSFEAGETPKSTDLMEIMGGHFRPEFLGRLTEIVPFSPITKENIIKIFKIQLKDLLKALEKQEISLELTDEVYEYLSHKGFTPQYGARPLRGVIRTDLRGPLSKMLITGKIQKGDNVKISLQNEALKWHINK
ncbi:ATP-dependent Clp protease ATP-binding subunit ClpA [Mesonia algae]|uniref:ATP-dependent Clp protease ATP-binding subunit ClpA n=1 Tax=Mesonia algae TaxID=213248 RepID=A0A2W7K1U9_9FLAO|nr:ATP-dependent Clp protease ATP-binding subunit [Mesonia algae]PZW41590.1 ATP-dependent Clp protease ATP-binding subunit ClpA [Mesonia algae]